MCDNVSDNNGPDTSDFRRARVGDPLWCMQLGDCYVSRVSGILIYVAPRNGGEDIKFFSQDGQHGIGTPQTLFWARPRVIAPVRPERYAFKRIGVYAEVDARGEIVAVYKSYECAVQREPIPDRTLVYMTGSCVVG